MSLPTLIWHISSSANPAGQGLDGNNYMIPLPDPGAGNCIVLGLSFLVGNTPTITDNNGNTWPAASVSAGALDTKAAIFVLKNANPGNFTVTVAFAAPLRPFQYTASCFNNVDTVSPVNGTSATADVHASSGSLTTGSFTPTTNNDANGGNIIWNYYASAQGGAISNPSNWVKGTNFTLLDADRAWTSNSGFPHASQWSIQTALGNSVPINPSITATGETGTTTLWNCVAIALKVAAAGTPSQPGIRIRKMIHQTNQSPGPFTLALQMPAIGNLRVITDTLGDSNIGAISDNEGGTWSSATTGGAKIWWSVNKSANPDLVVSFPVLSGVVPNSIRFYDISGAVAAPFDFSALESSTNVGGTISLTHAPDITPTTANGLVIASLAIGHGPGATVTSPAGAIFSLVTYITRFTASISGTVMTVPVGGVTQGKLQVGYTVFGAGLTATNPTIYSFGTCTGLVGTYNLSSSQGTIASEQMTAGETDLDLMENADLEGYVYNAASGLIHWDWTFTLIGSAAADNGVNGVAVAFKAAPAG